MRSLVDEAYCEVLPTKYERANFTKSDGSGNLRDHITIFEIECDNIANNKKLKLQHRRLVVELFTAHFESMEVLVKIEHLKLYAKTPSETFQDYVQ